MLLPLFLLFPLLFAPKECAKLGKEKAKQPSGPPSFGELDLQKRPLNFYIVANGKHAVVQNKSIVGHKGSRDIEYRIARPPFSIKQRGSILLLGHDRSLDWHLGYPSMLQMLAASGHAAVAVEQQVESAEVAGWEELHAIALLARGKGGAERALELIEKESRVRGQLDAVIAMDAPKAVWQRLERELAKLGGKKVPLVVLAKSGAAEKAAVNSEGTKLVAVDWAVDAPENAQRVAQIVVNLLDFVHPR